MTEEKKNDHVVTYRFPVPSKGSAARFATKRYLYEVWNIEETPLIEVPGTPPKVLRASITLRVFNEDYVDCPEKLVQFDELTPGLNPTFRELTHGIYMSKDQPLQILVKGSSDPKRMPAYILDPSRTDGGNEFMQNFSMNDLLQAASGDEQLDRIMRRGRPPLFGQRVNKTLTGSGVDAATLETKKAFEGWVFVATPGQPTVDYEKKTAVFNSRNDLGYAVYVPLSTVRLMANLYFKLEPRWRKLIEEEHVVVEGRKRDQATPRRFQLQAGRQERKPSKPAEVKFDHKVEPAAEAAGEVKPKRDRKRGKKDKSEAEAKAEDQSAATETVPSAPPTAQA